jgi:hypothetical protein
VEDGPYGTIAIPWNRGGVVEVRAYHLPPISQPVESEEDLEK